MPKPSKHTLSTVLMLLSILTLVVFQGFWLKKVYEEQRTFLQQKTDDLFKNTYYALQDSLIEKKFLPLREVMGDSVAKKMSNDFTIQPYPQTIRFERYKKPLSTKKQKLIIGVKAAQTFFGNINPKDISSIKIDKTDSLGLALNMALKRSKISMDMLPFIENLKPKTKIKPYLLPIFGNIISKSKNDSIPRISRIDALIANPDSTIQAWAEESDGKFDPYGNFKIEIIKNDSTAEKNGLADAILRSKNSPFQKRVTIKKDSTGHFRAFLDSVMKQPGAKTNIHIYTSSTFTNPKFNLDLTRPLTKIIGTLRNGQDSNRIKSTTTSNITIKINSHNKNNKPQEFSFNLESDTVKRSDLQKNYLLALQKSQLPSDFVLQKTNAKELAKTLALNASPLYTSLPTGGCYVAAFSGIRPYLFQKMLPQMLFSVFLLAMILLSFGLIYRNLQQQRRLAELKNDFISNITHELKTPITTVGVAIEALRDFNAIQNPALTKEYLEISKNELNRLSLLVDKVLKMSIFEQQGLSLNIEKVQLDSLVEEVLNSMKLQFEKCEAKVHFEKIGEHFTLDADKTHLTNVIYNLLDNALKYSPEKTEIAIQLQRFDKYLQLSVQDNGVGIAKEYQQKIFEKFFRVPTGNVHDTKGYGLGLSYVANVMEQHKGSIEVQSELGKGSRFTIKSPNQSQSPLTPEGGTCRS